MTDALQKIQYELFKDEIYMTECEMCKTSKNLTIHHKKKRSLYPELEYDVRNIQILCRNCHNKIHGIKNSHMRTV